MLVIAPPDREVFCRGGGDALIGPEEGEAHLRVAPGSLPELAAESERPAGCSTCSTAGDQPCPRRREAEADATSATLWPSVRSRAQAWAVTGEYGGVRSPDSLPAALPLLAGKPTSDGQLQLALSSDGDGWNGGCGIVRTRRVK